MRKPAANPGDNLIKPQAINFASIALPNFCPPQIAVAADMPETAILDNQCFGGYTDASQEELDDTRQHGAIIVVRDLAGRIVGHAAVYLDYSPQATDKLAQTRRPRDAVLYGFCVAKAAENRGVGGMLVAAAEMIIRSQQTQPNTTIGHRGGQDYLGIAATARIGNVTSAHILTKQGYRLIGYSNYYGEKLADRRGVFYKDLSDAPTLKEQPARPTDCVISVILTKTDADATTHRNVQQAIKDGYVGIGVARSQNGSASLIFRPVAATGNPDNIRQAQAHFSANL